MNHSESQEKLFEYYDGQLSASDRSAVDAHLPSCAPCRAELEAWRQTAESFIAPLRVDASEAFVQRVMGIVRAVPDRESAVSFWPARWAFPALTLSMAGFAAAFLYVVQPAPGLSDPLLLEDQDAPVTLIAPVPSEDQILRSIVEKP